MGNMRSIERTVVWYALDGGIRTPRSARRRYDADEMRSAAHAMAMLRQGRGQRSGCVEEARCALAAGDYDRQRPLDIALDRLIDDAMKLIGEMD